MKEVKEGREHRRKVVSLSALGSPIRVRILEVLTEWGPLSPNQIVLSGMAADVEGEVDPVALAEARTATYVDGRVVVDTVYLAQVEDVVAVGQRHPSGVPARVGDADQEAVRDEGHGGPSRLAPDRRSGFPGEAPAN